MIYRLVLLAFAVHASCGSAAIGSDYILRVDKIERTDGLTPEKEPKETTVCSIEVVARPHFPFHGRVSVGGETVSIAGKLRPTDKGEFVAQFHFEHLVNTGATISGDDGTRKPVIDKSVAQTSVTVLVGTGVDIGGLVMKDSKTRQIRHVVTLSRHESVND